MGEGLKAKALLRERRRWPRLPLAIPVFVRAKADADAADKEFLEFATALNVSAGGMLVAVRRPVPSSAQVLLEIPSTPLASMPALPRVSRCLPARVLRIQHGEGYNLLGLKFAKPLISALRPAKPVRRKVTSFE
jgi:hypothetical protein